MDGPAKTLGGDSGGTERERRAGDLTGPISATLTRILLDGSRQPTPWLTAAAEAVAVLFGNTEGGPAPAGPPVAQAALLTSAARGPWQVLTESHAEAPLSLAWPAPEVGRTAPRSGLVTSAEWSQHRPARLTAGIDDFVQVAVAAGWTTERAAVVFRVNQVTGKPWDPTRAARVLSLLSGPIAEAFDRRVAAPLRQRTTLLHRLSPAQRLVVEKLAGGMTEPEIAKALGREYSTVHDHVRAIYGLLGISSRFELIEIWQGRRPPGYARPVRKKHARAEDDD